MSWRVCGNGCRIGKKFGFKPDHRWVGCVNPAYHCMIESIADDLVHEEIHAEIVEQFSRERSDD